ncbi:AAA family ATPase [Leptotrichia buccalis]|uniref:ATPase AAA-type core domain-containing protein n=1 Tax=Leptotrichia buccalis (strain ATCC 14201 / DSM 1135 / JCM 12969 / NCTC 10249 / C-1013-b) TaxID=523794 RepID=C7ND87_LEPBD|nr:ATP-binding protein [Leptotrichia buccalis]ACV39965.1 hypothetical protein Lebu_2106 [Leptotrichia buccalis C-1013-b]
MLIDITVKNFRSFKNETVFSMEVDKKDILEDINTVKVRQNKKNHKKELLKSAVVIGGNASGKSNFIDILRAFKHYLLVKGKKKFRDDNFKLSKKKENTEIEINILIDDEIYNYLLIIDFHNKKIVSEKFYIINERKQEAVYIRENDKIMSYDKKIFSNYDTTLQFINENLNEYDSVMTRIIEYKMPKEIKKFIDYLKEDVIILTNDEINFSKIGKLFYKTPKIKDDFLNYLKRFGFPMENVNIIKRKLPEDVLNVVEIIKSKILKSDSLEENDVYDLEFIYKNDNGEKYNLSLSEQSSGTKKIISLFIPIYKLLLNGGILVIDELDETLHYKLVYDIIKMFNSIEHNKKNAQIIFSSHNLLLLDLSLFRRDQIWFVENNKIFEGSSLYSLSDIKGVRKDDNILRDYLNGFFGGLPNIDQFGVN